MVIFIQCVISNTLTDFSLRDYNDGKVVLSDSMDTVISGIIPEGWHLSQFDTVCRDLLTDCEHRAIMSQCENHPRWMLNRCRRTCSERYSNVSHSDLPEEIQDHGGIGDTFIDAFGFKINLCNLAEGFNVIQRDIYIHFHNEVVKTIPYIPKFTKEGFLKTKIPEHLYLDILEAREEALKKNNISVEAHEAGVLNCQTVLENDEDQSMLYGVPRTQMIELTDSVSEKIFKTLGPLAEEWTNGLRLQPTSVYGIRRYRNRSALISHCDKPHSHVISAILNIAQDLEEDWPLFIKDNEGRNHRVIMKPGEMVWYESARLIHGRQWPMKGQFYDNLFIHYKPRGKWYEEGRTRGKVMPLSEECVRKSQRDMEPTDWDKAWYLYQNFMTNSPLEAAQSGFRLGDDPFKEETNREEERRKEEEQHITVLRRNT